MKQNDAKTSSNLSYPKVGEVVEKKSKDIIHLVGYPAYGGIITYCSTQIKQINGKWLELKKNSWVETGKIIAMHREKVTCKKCLKQLALEEKQC